MTYEIAGRRPGAAPQQPGRAQQGPERKTQPQSEETPCATQAPRSPAALRRRGRIQVVVMAVVSLSLLGGARLGTTHQSVSTALSEGALQGNWQLQSVGGDPIGPKVASGVLSQNVVFDHGKIRGETRLLATAPAGTTQMPFPDQSVKQIKAGPEGYDATAIWAGTYHLLDSHRIALYIGQARYIVKGAVDRKTHSLTLNPDPILTYPGAARYSSQ